MTASTMTWWKSRYVCTYVYMLILVLFYLGLDLHNSLVTDTSNKKEPDFHH